MFLNFCVVLDGFMRDIGLVIIDRLFSGATEIRFPENRSIHNLEAQHTLKLFFSSTFFTSVPIGVIVASISIIFKRLTYVYYVTSHRKNSRSQRHIEHLSKSTPSIFRDMHTKYYTDYTLSRTDCRTI